MSIHIDKHIGITGLKVYWMHSKDGKLHWCRMPIAIMGSFNMPYEQLRKMSPFDPNFHDNYVEGKGKTREEALENMEKDMTEMSEVLWSI